MEGKQGAALLAANGSTPILPVGIYGSENINSYFWMLLSCHLSLFGLGSPIIFLKWSGRIDKNGLSVLTDEIMCRIVVLLPKEYRGLLCQPPQVKKELLAENDQA